MIPDFNRVTLLIISCCKSESSTPSLCNRKTSLSSHSRMNLEKVKVKFKGCQRIVGRQATLIRRSKRKASSFEKAFVSLNRVVNDSSFVPLCSGLHGFNYFLTVFNLRVDCSPERHTPHDRFIEHSSRSK